MKKLNKKAKVRFIFVVFSKMALISLLVGILVITPTIGVIYNSKKRALEEKMFGKKSDYQGIITLWNVDTFEGGTSSRSSFLEWVSLKFEKMYKGVYIKVENLTIDEMVANLKMGKKPNIFSFGNGISHYLEKDMLTLSKTFESRVLSNFMSSGLKNGELKALAWYTSGYCLLSTTEKIQKANGDETKQLKDIAFDLAFDTVFKKSTKRTFSLTFGKNQYVDALSVFSRVFKDKSVVTLAENMILDNKYNEQSPYDAYVNFVSGKSSMLLGTARDLSRLQSKFDAGAILDLLCEPLGEYTDLVGYISIIKSDDVIQKLCEEYISLLMSDNVQMELKNIGLFSTTGLKIYEEGIMRDFETCLNEKTIVKNTF